MDIFGRGNDTVEEGTSGDGGLEDRSAERERIEDLVSDVRSRPPGEQKETIEDITLRLDGSVDDRQRAARTLLAVAGTHPDVVETHAERIFDRLTERQYARPIAELLLSSAERLRWQGVDPDAVVDHLTDGLERTLGLVHQLEREDELVPAGGASEIALAGALREFATTLDDQAPFVIDATADALEGVPRAYAWSTGLDPIEAIVELQDAYESGTVVGIDRRRGDLRSVDETDLFEQRDELEARITDGITLAGIAIHVEGTVSQLDSITGRSPYPV